MVIRYTTITTIIVNTYDKQIVPRLRFSCYPLIFNTPFQQGYILYDTVLNILIVRIPKGYKHLLIAVQTNAVLIIFKIDLPNMRKENLTRHLQKFLHFSQVKLINACIFAHLCLNRNNCQNILTCILLCTCRQCDAILVHNSVIYRERLLFSNQWSIEVKIKMVEH